MNDAPTTVYDVSFVRNTGSSTEGDLYDDGVPIGVSGRKSRLHGEVGQVNQSGEEQG